MSTPIKPESPRVDQFFMAGEARSDRWRALLQASRIWDRSAGHAESSKAEYRATVINRFQELQQWEDYFAYPGQKLLTSVEERIASGDATGSARLIQSIGNALLTHSYRTNVEDWESEDQAPIKLGERVPVAGEDGTAHRPYFEVLIVSSARRTAWQELAQDFRKLRRPQDKFVYEPVFVSSFEDAVLATVLNGSIEAVIVYEGISFGSSHNSPVLREFLASHLAAREIAPDSLDLSMSLAEGLKQLRPELDIYFLSDRQVEKVAGDVNAAFHSAHLLPGRGAIGTASQHS